MDPIEYLAAAPVVAVAGLLIFAAASDARRYLIPNWISVGIIALFLPYALLSPVGVNWLGGLATAAAAFALGFGLYALRLMGGGDVKLITACALWAGPAMIAPFLVIVSLAGGALAGGLMIGRGIASARRRRSAPPGEAATGEAPLMRQKVPYGLAIAAGGLFLLTRHLTALGLTL